MKRRGRDIVTEYFTEAIVVPGFPGFYAPRHQVAAELREAGHSDRVIDWGAWAKRELSPEHMATLSPWPGRVAMLAQYPELEGWV